jgi:hypothetical protein
MGLSIRSYAKRRGCSHKAVQKALASGRIPRLPDGTIDPDAADRAWHETTAPRMRPIGVGATRTAGPAPAPSGAHVVDRGSYERTRTVKLAIEAQRAQIELEQRRGALISRDRAVNKAFSFARLLRDAWQAWPARIGPQLAARFEIDEVGAFVVALEDAVRHQLEELASERCEF